MSRVVDELSSNAREIADKRIQSFSDRLIDHFSDKPDLFDAFAEPDFQYSLRDAGRAAASNDEEHTEQLLVDLLTNRATEDNGARVRLATSQAIKAADKLSADALNGLTALWAVGQLDWGSPDLPSKIASADGVAQKLLALKLPADATWIEDADVLNLVRLSPVGLLARSSYAEMFRMKVKEQLASGIELEASRDLLGSVAKKIPELSQIVRQHPLKEGFVLLPGKDRDELISMLPSNVIPPPELNQLIEQHGFGGEDPAAVEKLEGLLAEREPLVRIAEWWDAVPSASFTVVGDVVGFVNASRYLSIDNAKTIADLLSFRSSAR